MMPSLPSRPSKDVDRIAASWLCKLLDCVAYAMTHPMGDGRTILNESSGTLRALRQPGGGTDGGGSDVSCVPAKIVSGTSPYTVDVYANGYDQAATSTGATAEVLMLNYAETLTAGTKVLALLAKTNVTGGEDVV